MSQAQGKLGESWTVCLAGPASIVFWRLANTSAAVVTAVVAVQNSAGDTRPMGQALLNGAPAGKEMGGALEVLDGGQKLTLGSGEKAVAKCTTDQAVSFRIGE